MTRTSLLKRWTNIAVTVWVIGVGAVIGYLLLRPSPSASGLPMTPHWLIDWLNRHHDLRTLPMAWGYAILPALLLWDRKSPRWTWLGVMLGLLWLGETAQLTIPSRRFTWPDMLFSLGGVVLAEGCAIALARWPSRIRNDVREV